MIDRVVSAFSPERGLARAHARALLAMSGGYNGADRSRRALRWWDARPTSADQATLSDLVNLRSSSRDLVRNNPLACGVIGTVTTSVVGTGLSVHPQIAASLLGMTTDQAKAWQRGAKEWFEMWASNALWCDVSGQQSFYEQQDLVFRSAMESGDAFALMPMMQLHKEPLITKVQIIEADRVCNPSDKPTSEQIAAGIEIDAATGRPVKCYIANKHPGSYHPGGLEYQEFEFFGAETGRRNVLHLMTRLRPGQRRGVPYLAPVIESFKQLGTYTDAEVTAAVVSSMFTVFIKKDAEEGPFPPGGAHAVAAPKTTAANEVNLSAGAMVDLAPGEDVVMANPLRPNTAFDPFVMAVLRQMGSALELPVELVIKHFTASYSASRAAMLEAWRFFKKRRYWLASQFCQPVYEAVISEAVMRGYLTAPGFLTDPMIRAAYCRAEWIGDAPGALNPIDEAKAAELRIAIGISTRTKESIAFDGSNWEDNHQQQVIEEAARKRDGLELAAPPDGAADPGGTSQNDQKP